MIAVITLSRRYCDFIAALAFYDQFHGVPTVQLGTCQVDDAWLGVWVAVHKLGTS